MYICVYLGLKGIHILSPNILQPCLEVREAEVRGGFQKIDRYKPTKYYLEVSELKKKYVSSVHLLDKSVFTTCSVGEVCSTVKGLGSDFGFPLPTV